MTFTSRCTSNNMRALGVTLEATEIITIEGGKIKTDTWTVTEESMAALQAAMDSLPQAGGVDLPYLLALVVLGGLAVAGALGTGLPRSRSFLLHLCGFPPVQGQDAVRQLYHGFLQLFVSTTITSRQIHVSPSGDMAWDQGGYVNVVKGPEGEIREEGKYLGLYHKVEGKWKGAAFCITPNG